MWQTLTCNYHFGRWDKILRQIRLQQGYEWTFCHHVISVVKQLLEAIFTSLGCQSHVWRLSWGTAFVHHRPSRGPAITKELKLLETTSHVGEPNTLQGKSLTVKKEKCGKYSTTNIGQNVPVIHWLILFKWWVCYQYSAVTLAKETRNHSCN